MSRITDELAVQSWCYRNFKTAKDLIAKVKETGLSRVELCGVHADFNKPQTFDETLKPYADAGITIVSLGVETFDNDEAFMRSRFEFTKKAGCKIISVHFKPATFLATLPIANQLCKEYGVKLAIHNHGGYHWLGNSEILDWIFSFTCCRIGLNMDTAWALDARQNPVEWAQKYAERLYAVHLKDFVFDRARKSTDVVVGAGNLDLPRLCKTLKANQFAGPPILEYEGDVNNPVPALIECVEAVKKADAES